VSPEGQSWTLLTLREHDVFIPLPDNKTHIEVLCSRLQLGQPLAAVSSLTGGFHHRVWKLPAANGCFVIKQLSADSDPGDAHTVRHYNVTEAVAEKFAQCGIAAVHALKYQGHYLQVLDNEGYLVYPWTDAVALAEGEVSIHHALAVARLLASMHEANIDVAGVESKLADATERADVEKMIGTSEEADPQMAAQLNEHRALLCRIAEQYRRALPRLGRRQIVSHGDLDQKNVLWDADDNAVIIDWESAHKMNPTQEVTSVALEWSGITEDFDRHMFSQFVTAYTQSGGIITRDLFEAALHGVLGKWLDWLMYNIGRAVNLEEVRQHELGEQQVSFILPVMVRLDGLVPELLDDLSRQSAQATVPQTQAEM
jgi:phosphotransferase family enzyme